MAFTYEELAGKTVAELRTIADGVQHDAVKGHLTMHKEQLLPALCTALGIERPHHVAASAEKTIVKKKIRALKKERDAALAAKDSAKTVAVREKIHRLKRALRKSVK